MILSELAAAAPDSVLQGAGDLDICGLAYDSRQVVPGDLFVALRGSEVDGRRYAASAIEKGAVAVAAEGVADSAWRTPFLKVPDSRRALAELACAFHGNPSHDLRVAGVTGTNGKSTTAIIAKHLLDAAQRRSGLIGTIGNDVGDGVQAGTHTTPESLELQGLLSEMRENGCASAVMEVSSHGLDQDRVRGVRFRAAAFMNLTQDHLDFHGTMEAYFDAKRTLFEMTAEEGGLLVINGDDPYGRRLLDEFGKEARCLSFGSGFGNDLRVSNWRIGFDGTQFDLEAKGRSILVKLPLIGRFNISNALAALGLAEGCGCNFREAVRGLATCPQVPGRLENVSLDAPFRVFVDYAHTPDALTNVLAAVRGLNPRRLVTVFGCGGDRDREKRPLMAKAAEEGSDLCVLTSDNPRGEDPELILRDAARGFRSKDHLQIVDRREAIRTAILKARPHDVVVVAGKGHEDYQEIDGVKQPFNDRKICEGFVRESLDRGFRKDLKKED